MLPEKIIFFQKSFFLILLIIINIKIYYSHKKCVYYR